MATSTGTFGIPNAWIYNSGAYNNTSGTLDQKKARDYLRGQLPDYTFSDPELDILVAGNYLPNAPETYLTNYTAPSAKVVADGGSTDVNTGSTVVVDEKVSSGALPTDFQLDPVVSGDAPPPPPPSDAPPPPSSSGTGDSAEVSDSVLGGGTQAQAGPYIDPNTGRFYGTGGSFIDPITGQMQFNNFNAPVYDANAVFQQRDFGSYNEIFPVTMYGMAPAQTLAELDRIGLGLDYVRNNLNQEDLQKWWNQVFTPLYQNILGRTQTTTEVSSGGTASPFLSGYNTGNLLFGQTDPGQMGQGFDLSQSLNFGLDPTSFLGQVYGGINQIGDVTVSPDQFSIDQAATEKALTDQLGQILLNPDQFGIDPGTAEALRNQLNISVGADQFNLDPYTSRNLLSQLGLIDVGANQFNVNSDQIRSALTDRLGQILIDPSQFALGSQVVQGDTPGSYQVITPQDKLLQDLGLIDVGAGQFSLDSNAVQDYLLNQLGDISLDPNQFSIDSNAADILRNQLVSGIAPILASDIRVDPLSIAQDIRGDITSGISPITIQDLQYDPLSIAQDIRGDITSGISPIGRDDIGLGDEQIADLLDPLLSRIGALPEQFQSGAGAELGSIISGLENRLSDIEGFSAGDQFLRPETTAAQNLYDILYGTTGGSGPSGGISGFQAPASIQQLSDQVGTFGPNATGLAGQIQGLQNALTNLDVSSLNNLPDFQSLIGDVGQLNEATAAGVENLGGLRDALGAFSPEDQQIMGLLLDILGPDGISSLTTEQLQGLITQIKSGSTAATGLIDNLSNLQGDANRLDLSNIAAPEGLDALLSGVSALRSGLPEATTGLEGLRTELGSFSTDDMSRMNTILDLFGSEGIRSLNPEELRQLGETFGLTQQDLFSQYLGDDSRFNTGMTDIEKILRILNQPGETPVTLEQIEEAIRNIVPAGSEGQGGSMPTGSTGAGGANTGTTSATTSGFLKTLEEALTGKITDQPDITSDYLRSDPITASLLADLQESQRQQGQSLQEQLQRFGVISSGDALQALPELASAQRREELDVLSDAAQRITGERQEALNQGLDLGRTLTTREQALGTLLGTVDGQQTLDSRAMDLDILAAAIAALDPNLDPGTKDPAQKGIAMALLKLLGMEDDPFLADLVNALGLRE